MSSKALKDEHKRYIVQSLARFVSPSEVVAGVKQEYDIEVSMQALQVYDPTTVAGKRLGETYCQLFEETRKSYLTDLDNIGIAQQPFRLNKLHEMAMSALSRKNYAQAAQFMEQAAKETGGMFTNRREVSGPNGGAIQLEAVIDAGINKIYGDDSAEN